MPDRSDRRGGRSSQELRTLSVAPLVLSANGSRSPVQFRLVGFMVGNVPSNDVLGADPDDLRQLAVAVRAASGTVGGADARLRQRLVSVTWEGTDASDLRRTLGVEVRGSHQRAVGELRTVADRLESQALEQRQTSGDAAAGPGERPGEVRTEPGHGPSLPGGGEANPTPITVLTETHTVGVEGGISPGDGKAEATLTLSVADDGTAQVAVRTDQRIGALAGQASGGTGIGLTGTNEVEFSFDDEATARRFIKQMADALTPDLEALGNVGAPHPVLVGLGLGAPALVVGGGKAIFDDVSRDAAEVLIANMPSKVEGSVGGSADVWGTVAIDRLDLDAEVARGAIYDLDAGTWTARTSIDSGVSAPIFGELKADLNLNTSVSTTIGPDGVTEGTWTVEATGGGGAEMLAALGLGATGPGLDLAGSSRVRFEARLPANDAATRDALNEFNQGAVAPHRVAATLDQMVRQGDLSVTVEQRDASDGGRSYGPVRIINQSAVTRVDSVFRKSPSDEWTQVELPNG